MKKGRYTDKNYWDSYWNSEVREEVSFCFEELIDRYIRWDSLKSYMEIGGAPGNILAFMNKEHKMSVAAVDFTEKSRIENYLNAQGVKDYQIYQSDFLNFDVEGHKKKYDLVASWGFIEHFEKKVTARFVEKQKCMVSDKGYLIIELPNIRKIMWLVYWIFNRDVIKTHNLKVMDLTWLKKCVLKKGDFKIIYASYYMAMNEQNVYFLKHKLMSKICRKIIDFFNKHNFRNSVKKWFFPYIIIIAKREGTN